MKYQIVGLADWWVVTHSTAQQQNSRSGGISFVPFLRIPS